VGGSQIIKVFFEENLVQDLIVFVVPIILGSGIPLFDHIGKEIGFRTGRVERYENGLVKLEYEENLNCLEYFSLFWSSLKCLFS
jgi:dihydrofolate reductase